MRRVVFQNVGIGQMLEQSGSKIIRFADIYPLDGIVDAVDAGLIGASHSTPRRVNGIGVWEGKDITVSFRDGS